jgi:hypothetical protein
VDDGRAFRRGAEKCSRGWNSERPEALKPCANRRSESKQSPALIVGARANAMRACATARVGLPSG